MVRIKQEKTERPGDVDGSLSHSAAGRSHPEKMFKLNPVRLPIESIKNEPKQFGTPTRGGITYTYDVLGLGSETDSSGNTTRYLRDDKGNLVELMTGGEEYFYMSDALGSITGVTGAGAAVASNYTYRPYGEGKKGAEDWTPYNPWRFASGYLDNPTDVYKFGTRYYSPDILRWTQQDPKRGQLKDPMDAQNPYVYVNGNPVNALDSSGRDAFGCITGGAGIFVGTLGLGLGIAAAASGVFAMYTGIGAPAAPVSFSAAGTLLTGGYRLTSMGVGFVEEEC